MHAQREFRVVLIGPPCVCNVPFKVCPWEAFLKRTCRPDDGIQVPGEPFPFDFVARWEIA
jgi:hypothetical protein